MPLDKAIIFDFDGVILESLEVKSKAFYDLYLKYGKSIANKVKNHHNNNPGINRFEKFKFYATNFIGKKITDKEAEDLSKKLSNLILKKILHCDFVYGVRNFIKSNKKNYLFFISSATPENELRIVTNHLNISKFFNKIYGSPASKKNHIKKIIKLYNLNKRNVLFLGDAYADYKAASLNNINFILIENEYNKKISMNNKILRINNFYNFNNTLKKKIIF